MKKYIIGGEASSISFESLPRTQISQLNKYFPPILGAKRRVFMQVGADALTLIFLNESLKSPIETIWVPEHYCWESLERFTANFPNVQIAPYKNLSSLANLTGATRQLVLLSHYGQYSNEIGEWMPPLGVNCIEDFVHAPFEIRKSAHKYAFNSLRKVYLGDIAVTYGPFESEVLSLPLKSSDSEYKQIKTQAQLKRSENEIESTLPLEREVVKLFAKASAKLNRKNAYFASIEDIEALDFIDIDRIILLRRENCEYLRKMLEGTVEIIAGDYFYLIISSYKRNAIKDKLNENRIYPVIHWLDAETDLSKVVLSLPIDQRYDKQDMDKIISIIMSC